MLRALFFTLAMPPTGFVVLIAIGLLFARSRPRFGRGVAWAGLVLLILMGMPAVSSGMLIALERDLPTVPPVGQPPQAIIILGGEVIRARDEALGTRPGLLTLDRLRTGARLHRKTGLPILVTGGVTQPGSEPVGRVMQKSLQDDFQTPAKWLEPKSSDTWENARFSADILRAEGITSVYVVTHAWHMQRALLAFQGTGLTVTAAPTSLDEPLGPDLFDFIPRASGWQTSYYALHEWIGYAWYKLR